jgi:hypothetical protein
MLDPFKYTTLITSLPHQPALFTEKQTVISRIRLEIRLTMLAEDDAQLLRGVEAVLSWSRQEFELTDEEIVRRARRVLDELPEGLIRDLVLWRLEMRTLVAALRRRKAGAAAPAAHEIFGHGRWLAHIRRHWSEPDFGLGGVFPFAAEANRLLAADDTIGLQRLLLTEAWQQLGRIGDEHEFDLPAVIAYVLRWSIIDGWSRYDVSAASDRFDELLRDGLGEHARLAPQPNSQPLQ